MKRFLKRLLWLLLVVFIVIQFFRPTKNISSAEPVNHISTKFNMSNDVQDILKASCYDCHSNNTAYPWYFNVQPVSWWLGNHIEDGKKEVNFDEFATYSLRRQFKKFKEIKEQVDEGEMPLPSYILIHRSSTLTAEQKEAVIKWAKEMMNEMKSNYPMDSLVRKEQRG
jgi:hypothetical protein